MVIKKQQQPKNRIQFKELLKRVMKCTSTVVGNYYNPFFPEKYVAGLNNGKRQTFYRGNEESS